MSGTRAELATQALVAHSPVVPVTRVEERIQQTLCQMPECIVWQHRFRRKKLCCMSLNLLNTYDYETRLGCFYVTAILS